MAKIEKPPPVRRDGSRGMGIRITGMMDGKVEVKRFYLPGIDIITTCPNCGYEHEWEGDYLSYPDAGIPIDLPCCCLSCEHEWDERVILTIELKPAPPEAP